MQFHSVCARLFTSFGIPYDLLLCLLVQLADRTFIIHKRSFSSPLTALSSTEPHAYRGVFFVQKTGACHRHAPVGIRQRPTLPGRFQPSTIGAKRLNFCVRDGNRWIPLAITTGNSSGCSLAFPLALCSALPRLACPDNCTAQVDLGTSPQYFSLLLRLSPRPISISNLHRLRGFQR